MPLKVYYGNILDIKNDAIVNPTDIFLSGSGSIDKILHDLSEGKLKTEFQYIQDFSFGSARLTPSYNNIYKFIIHTAGPYWTDSYGDVAILRNCYSNIFQIIQENRSEISSVSIPIIASGSFKFPLENALTISMNAINEYLQFDEKLDINLFIYTEQARLAFEKLYKDINIINIFSSKDSTASTDSSLYMTNNLPKGTSNHIKSYLDEFPVNKSKLEVSDLINKYFKNIKNDQTDNASFADVYYSLLNKYNLQNSKVCGPKGADLNKTTMSKLLNPKTGRKPSKDTVLALCIALPINHDEMIALCKAAGKPFEYSNPRDKLVDDYIKNVHLQNKIYSLYEYNMKIPNTYKMLQINVSK